MKQISKKYKRKREHKNVAADGSLFLKSTLGTLLLSLATGGGLLLSFALILCLTPDPLSLVLPAGLLSAAIAAFMGGFFATRLYHLPALSAGLINGILLTVLSLFFSFLFAKDAACYATGYSAAVSALLHIGVVGLSIGGAFLGGRKRTHSRRRKKLRR